MKNTMTILLFFWGLGLNAQVGINTTTPKATLDINGNIKIRTISTVPSVAQDHMILARDQSEGGDHEIIQISPSAIPNANDRTVFSAQKNGGWSLLALAVGGSWYKINVSAADKRVGNPALFTNGVYKAPKSGTYAVTYDIQFKSGVNLEVLGGKSLGIFKNATLWEQKVLDGVRISILSVSIASLPLTSTTLTTLIELQENEEITFAMNTDGVLPINLGVLTEAKVSVNIYRIASAF